MTLCNFSIMLISLVMIRAVFSFTCSSSRRNMNHMNFLRMRLIDQPNIMTMSRFVIEAERSDPDHADFESIMMSIQLGCKSIANLVSREGIVDVRGINANADLSGKTVRLFELASLTLKNALRFTGKVGVLPPSNNTEDDMVLIDEAWNSQYVAVFDPLEGAVNLDVNTVTGTIFSIYKVDDSVKCCMDVFGDDVIGRESELCLAKVLTPDKLVASGYCMYSSSTIMVFSMGQGVHGFTLDPNIGEFVLTHPNIKIPPRGRIYSFNEANAYKWTKGLQKYVSDIKLGFGEQKKSYTLRYIGSLLGDVHRTLLYGGIYGYPADSKRPRGKLQLLHEVRALAFLIEQAGGKASTGYGPIMSVLAEDLSEHVPTFLGSFDDVKEVESYLATDVGY